MPNLVSSEDLQRLLIQSFSGTHISEEPDLDLDDSDDEDEEGPRMVEEE